jgi:hypothetical protein
LDIVYVEKLRKGYGCATHAVAIGSGRAVGLAWLAASERMGKDG